MRATLFGDAFDGGEGGGAFYGDADAMTGRTLGGDDQMKAGTGLYLETVLYGDAYTLSGSARGGNDTLDPGRWGVTYGDAFP